MCRLGDYGTSGPLISPPPGIRLLYIYIITGTPSVYRSMMEWYIGGWAAQGPLLTLNHPPSGGAPESATGGEGGGFGQPQG